MKAEVQVLKTDFSQVAKANDIIINPGANVIVLEAKVNKICISFEMFSCEFSPLNWSFALGFFLDIFSRNIPVMPSCSRSEEF